MRMPMSLAALGIVLARARTAKPDRLRPGLCANHPRRGAARPGLSHAASVPPTVVATARALNKTRNETLAEKGIAVISVPDNRWGRVDIKTVGLLPNVLARQAAIDQGVRDAWFVDGDGKITEAASANAWIVSPGGALVTRHADHAILRGITRTVALDVVKAQGLTVEERGFTLAEAYAAREAFETSATQIVMPVVSIDGHKIGDGKPGPVALALRREFHRFAEAG